MQLLIIGTLEGQIGAASQMAIQRGAKVSQVDTAEAGLAALRDGGGADLAMIDVMLDVGAFISPCNRNGFPSPWSPAASATTPRPRSGPFAPEPRNTCRCRRART